MNQDPQQNLQGNSHSLEPLNLAPLNTYSIQDRKNLVSYKDFPSLPEPSDSVAAFIDSLPNILAAKSMRELVYYTARSIRKKAPVVVAMGGHVVKVGMAPILIDLMKRGCIQALVMNGATAIHDYEIAYLGETSEDVGSNILNGTFGMARETAQAFADAAARYKEGVGLGRAIGEQCLADSLPYAEYSLLAMAAKLQIPVTVHVGIGTDTIHMHPSLDGADFGAASHLDFRLLASIVSGLASGTWINIGSAVVLPEVFLKVVSIARNLGHKLEDVTAINFDMLQQYRTSQNVIRRPVARGFSIIGHHEINIPLFRLALLQELSKPAPKGESNA